MTGSGSRADAINYLLATCFVAVFFVLILTPLDTFRLTVVPFLLLGLANSLLRPKALLSTARDKEVALLAIAMALYAGYEILLSVVVRGQFSEREFSAHLYFIAGVFPLLVVVRHGWHRPVFIYVLLIGVFIGAVYSLDAMVNNATRVRPEGFNTIYWGVISALQFGFLFLYTFFYRQDSTKLFTLLLLFSLGLALANLIASGSRGPLVAIFAALPVTVILLSKNRIRSLIIAFLGVVCVASALYLFAEKVPGNFFSQRISQAITEVQEHTSGTIKRTSVGLRLQMWDVSQSIISENLFFGVPDSEIDDYKRMAIDDGRAVPYLMVFKHMHNDTLDAFVRKGLVGVFLYALLLGVLLRNGLRASSNLLGACLVYSVLLYFFSGLTNAYTASWRGLALILIFALFFYQPRPSEDAGAQNEEAQSRSG